MNPLIIFEIKQLNMRNSGPKDSWVILVTARTTSELPIIPFSIYQLFAALLKKRNTSPSLFVVHGDDILFTHNSEKKVL